MVLRDRTLLGKSLLFVALALGASACESGDEDEKNEERGGEEEQESGGAGDAAVLPPVDAPTKIVSQLDVPTCMGGDVQLYADLAYPEGKAENEAAPRPALIFIHGGGWTQGSRKDMREFVNEAARRGYVAASVQYRLTEPVFPAEIHDVKCAVRWMRAEAGKFGADPASIAVFGASAGAHLALMLGSTAGDPSFEGEGGYPGVSSAVKAVVNWFGPTDLAALYVTLDQEGKAGFDKNLGGPPDAAPEVYARYSPLTWLNAASAPTFTVHGDADGLVPYEQALALQAGFAAVEAPHALYTVLGGGHGFRSDETLTALQKSFEFLDQQLSHKP